MTTLPLDILATIIDDLAPSIPEELFTLRALSLTSRALTPLAQRLLFRRIEFRAFVRRDTSKTLIPAFAQLLAAPASRHLAAYVQHLAYAGRYDHIGAPLAALAKILDALTSLRSLHFSWLSYPGLPREYDFDYSTLTKDPDPSAASFCSALLSQLRSACLTELRAPSVRNFPFAAFIDKAAVLDLTEDAPASVSVRIVQFRPEGVRAPQASVCVRRYSVGASQWPRRMIEINVGGRRCLRPPSAEIPPLDLSNTKVLLLNAKEQINVVEAEKVLRCATGLEELSYEVTQASWFRNLAHTLLSSSSLNTLTTLDLSSTSEADADPLAPILEELAVLAASPSGPSSLTTTSTTSPLPPNTRPPTHHHPLQALQHLSLSLPLDLTHAPLPARTLRKLDLLLASAFPRLKTFHLHVVLLQTAPWEEVVRTMRHRRGGGELEEGEIVSDSDSEGEDGEGVELDFDFEVEENEREGENGEQATGHTTDSPTDSRHPFPFPSPPLSLSPSSAEPQTTPQAEPQAKQKHDPARLLAKLQAAHLACLPRTRGQGAPPGVEVHYSSVLRLGAAYFELRLGSGDVDDG